MPAEYEIRALYDTTSITVYQAYSPAIALPAIEHNRFVPPFSLHRMTWIKPSFLWLMERSSWAQKPGQEMILAIRITRQGWEEALSQAVLSAPLPGVYQSTTDWRAQLDQATVVVQWDPERSIRGKSLPHESIQVGLSRHIISRYVEEWTVQIQDVTPLAHKLYQLLQTGEGERVQRDLPRESPYPTPPSIARRLGMPIQ